MVLVQAFRVPCWVIGVGVRCRCFSPNNGFILISLKSISYDLLLFGLSLDEKWAFPPGTPFYSGHLKSISYLPAFSRLSIGLNAVLLLKAPYALAGMKRLFLQEIMANLKMALPDVSPRTTVIFDSIKNQ